MGRKSRGVHARYDIPHYAISGPEDVVTDELALYTMPLDGGLQLSFVYRGPVDDPADPILVCTFPGARDPKVVDLPYFVRFKGLASGTDPFLLFSDPTLALAGGLKLAWFIGTDGVDPLDSVERIVRYVMRRTGVGKAQFEGSSGGGLAALRLNLRFDDAGALVFSPQTDATAYEGGSFASVLGDAAFGTGDLSQLRRVALDRFDVASAYARYGRDKLVHYWQNSGDLSHLKYQVAPFIAAVRGPAGDSGARVRLRLFEGGEGHLAPPPGIWEQASDALRRDLRKEGPRPGSPSAPIPLDPMTGVQTRNLAGSGLAAQFVVVPGRQSSGPVRVFLQSAVDRTAGPEGRFRRPVPAVPGGAADVYVADPTLDRYESVPFGAYIGDGSVDVTSAVVDVVKTFVDAHHPASAVVYVGHSVGGFAAMQMAEQHEGAVSVTFSPVLDVPSFGTAGAAIVSSAFEAGTPETAERRVRLSVLARLSSVSRSDAQATKHLVYVDDATPMLQRRLLGDLRSNARVRLESRDFGPGHVAPRPEVQNRLISRATAERTGAGTGTQVHAAIYGSCVARDTVGYLGWSVMQYVARQSFISAATGPAQVQGEWHLDSPFQTRSLQGDIDGNALALVAEVRDDVDVVLVDLTDERLGVLDLEAGGTLTRSWELESSGLMRSETDRMRHVDLGSPEHLARWTEAARTVLGGLRDLALPVIVVAPPWAERTDRGELLTYRGRPVSFYNDALDRYLDVLDHLAPPSVAIVRLGHHLVTASAENRWGLAPYHYSVETYEALAVAIDEAWQTVSTST